MRVRGGRCSRAGSGCAGRGMNRGAGGTGRGRPSGAGGLTFGVFGLVGELLRARKGRKAKSIGDHIGSSDVRGTDALPAGDHEIPPKSRTRQTRNNSFFASVDLERCSGCGICVQVCPAGAISTEHATIVDAERCTGCGRCVTECPQGALILKKRSGAKEIHSQGRTKEMAVKIDKEKCTGCGSCVEVCSVEALSLVDNLAVVDPDLCVECGVCVDECPVEAISLP